MKTNYFIHFNRISSLLLTTFFLLRNHFEKKKTYHHLPVSLIPAKLSNEKYTNSFLFHSPPPIAPLNLIYILSKRKRNPALFLSAY